MDNDNEDTNGAKNAIDLDFDTRSYTIAGVDGRSGLKITLPQDTSEQFPMSCG